MGIWSAISSGFSAICSGVGKMVSGLSDFAIKYGPTILGNLSPVLRVFSALAQVFNIFKPDEDIENMGDLAIQAGEAGIQMENYSNYDEYLDAIRNFELDPEKSKTIDDKEKMLVGVGLVSKGIEDKFNLPEGVGGLMTILAATHSGYFTESRFENWLQTGEMGDIIRYFDNKLSPAESSRIIDVIVGAEKEFSLKSEDEIYQDLVDAQDALGQKDC